MTYFEVEINKIPPKIPHKFVDDVQEPTDEKSYRARKEERRAWRQITEEFTELFRKSEEGCRESLAILDSVPKHSEMFYFLKRLYYGFKNSEVDHNTPPLAEQEYKFNNPYSWKDLV